MTDVAIRLSNVSFSYDRALAPCLQEINLHINDGEFCLITGETGCGKSTLLKMFNGQIPHKQSGQLSGQVIINGMHTIESSMAELSKDVGLVLQNPNDQIFSQTVFEEVAFVLENRGLDTAQINSRVMKILQTVGLQDYAHSSTQALSGGQKQRLTIAAVAVAEPRILVLDEPISQLDPLGAQEVLQLLVRLNQEQHTTIVIVEHRIHELLEHCHTIWLLDRGRIVWSGTRSEFMGQAALFMEHGIRVPQTLELASRLGLQLERDDVELLATQITQHYQFDWIEVAQTAPVERRSVLSMHNIRASYQDGALPILKGIDLELFSGEIIVLMGKNGAGKSTLLNTMVGLKRPDSGQIFLEEQPLNSLSRRIGITLQNPDLMLFNQTVKTEINYALQQGGDYWDDWLQDLSEQLSISAYAEEFPLALSRGQRLRVALAAVFAVKPGLVILDEPTTGQNIGKISDIMHLIRAYALLGNTVVICTHDSEIAAANATRVLIMNDGKIVSNSSPRATFAQTDLLRANNIKELPVMQLAQKLCQRPALSVSEVIANVYRR